MDQDQQNESKSTPSASPRDIESSPIKPGFNQYQFAHLCESMSPQENRNNAKLAPPGDH